MWINNAQFVRTVLVLLAAPRRRPMCCRHCGLFFLCYVTFFCSPPTRWYRTPVCVPEPFCFTNEALLKGMICRTAPKNARSVWRRLCSPPVFPRVRSILTCWGRFWASTFLESGVPTRLTLLHLWFSLQVCVSVESDTAEVWVCLCQPGSSLTLSLAGIHLLWSLLLRSEPGASRAPGSLMSLMVEVLTGSHRVLMEVLVLK